MALTGPRDNGYDIDLIAEAQRAARRAGLSLPDWLDAVSHRSGAAVTGRPGRRDATAQAIAALHSRLDDLQNRANPGAHKPAEHTVPRDLVSALEERLQSIARRMEAPEAMRHAPAGNGPAHVAAPDKHVETGEPVKDLKAAIAEIAARQQTLEQEFDKAASGYADRVDHRIDMFADRLERRLGETSASHAIRDLEAEVRSVGARLDQNRGSAATELREELFDLVRRLEEVPARVADDIAPRLEDTARRLDTATRSEFDTIRAEMREIAQEIDRVNRSEFELLRNEIAKLTERVVDSAHDRSQTAATGLDDAGLAELAAIREDIRRLESGFDGGRKDEYAALRDEMRALSENVAAHPAERLHDLERHMGVLAERLDAGAASAPDGLAEIERQIARLAERLEAPDEGEAEGFPEIEHQLARLAERLEASSGGNEDLANIERQITRLAEHFDTAAQRLANFSELESTIGELYRRLEQDRGSSEIVAALKLDLVELKSNVDAADRRNQDTLGAVHQTLIKIVDRLNDLEEEVEEAAEEARHNPAPAPDAPFVAPQPAGDVLEAGRSVEPGDLAERIEAVTRAFDRDIEDNTPLAPGSGRPRVALDPVDRSARADTSTDRENFIAAARRAAQAASAEQFTDTHSSEKQQGKLAALLPMARRSPRMIALALAFVVLAAGAATIISLAGERSQTGEAPQAEPASALSDLQPPAGQAREPDEPSAAHAADQQVSLLTVPPRVVEIARAAEAEFATGTVTPHDGQERPTEAPAGRSGAAASPDALNRDERAETQSRLPSRVEMELPASVSGKLRKAVATGDPAAQFEVAARFTDGRGVGQDFAKAAHWYRLAAAQGLAPAQYSLGSLYEKGHGLTRDLSLAKMWYQRAAEQGNRKAMHNLAVLHADNAAGEPDFEQAALWFRQASEHGLKDSQYNLGVLYGRGLGTERNMSEAYKWFALAAAQGDAEAGMKRDEVAHALDEQTLAELRLALQSWQPRAAIVAANTVAEPASGWHDEPVAPAAPAMDARELVRQAQRLLAQIGYQPGPVDGEAGARTREAVLAFQRETGLSETGEITPDLLDELQNISG